MLTLLFLHLLITIVCFFAGTLFYSLFLSKTSVGQKPFIFTLITGLIFLTLLAQIAAIFIPLRLWFCIPVMAITTFSGLFIVKKNGWIPSFSERLRSVSKYHWFAIGSAWIMVLLFNAGPIRMDDSESYHIQMVKWLQQYGSVPGIANLHERYGFNSSWFSSVSFFLFSDNSPLSFSVLNGVLSMWFCVYVITRIKPGISDGLSWPGWLVILLMALYCWPMLRNNPATVNYDFVTALAIFVLFIKSIRSAKEDLPYLEWIIWPVYMFTVRIINYPLLLLSLIALIQMIRSKEWRSVNLAIIYSLFLVVPFLARNIILSGYPFYPAPHFDFLNLDWRADPEMMVRLNEFIKYYNRVNVTHLEIEATKNITFPSWLVPWFKYVYWFDKPILITGLAGMACAVTFIKRISKGRLFAHSIFLTVFLVQIISWFMIAPDPRFIYGVLLSGLYLLLVLLIKIDWKFFNSKVSDYALVVCSAALIFYSGTKFIREKDFFNPLRAKSLPVPPVDTVVVDHIKMYIPQKILNNWNPRCYGIDLPCLYIRDPHLKARGRSISDGFKLEK